MSGSNCCLANVSLDLLYDIWMDMHHKVDVKEIVEEPAFFDHGIAEYVAELESINVT